MKIRFVLLLLWAASLAGCTTTVIPPARPSHPTSVLITDYGRHSSLLLPDPDGRFVEYAFGDWNWYALGHKNAITAVFALIDSPQATLGRRWIEINPASKPNAAEVARQVGAERAEQLEVDGDSVTALRQNLDREYTRHIDSVIYNPEESLYFVRCDEPYNLFRNCNRVTGNWLKLLGVQLHGLAIMSHFHVVLAAQPGSAQ